MPIMLKRKDGSVTPYRNSEFIPAYYLIPRSFLAKCGKELNALPKQPYQVFRDWNAIATVESDLFRQLMMDGYAHLVWPYMMGAETPREAYSGYDPAWILAHSAGFWVQELTDKGIIPTVETLYQSASREETFGDVSMDELDIMRKMQ